MATLQLNAIEKHYHEKRSEHTPAFSIQSTTVTIREGEFFSLLGPSGCGKTTLLKLVAGLLAPDEGDILLNSKIVTSIVPEKRGISMVFQEALLFPHMTVVDNVAFGLKMKGVSKKPRLKKAKEMLSSVGLKDFDKRYPSELSGGQKQRVSLARAIVTEPRLLLMDEPFSGLDPELREEMRELVARMHKEHGVTILFVTHDREEAFQLSDRIGVMEEGAMLQIGKPRDLYEKPIHPNVALFLGAKNVLPGKLQGGKFISSDFQFHFSHEPGLTEAPGWLVIRPETIMMKTEAKPAEDRMNGFEGMINVLSFYQGFYYMKVKTGSKILDVIQKAEPDLDLSEGKVSHFNVDSAKLHFIPKKKK